MTGLVVQQFMAFTWRMQGQRYISCYISSSSITLETQQPLEPTAQCRVSHR
jgi:hypothetical protein